MLVPVIGLVQVGEQSMADRYTYLPSIGLFVLLTWGASAAFARWRLPKAVCGLAAGAALLPCAWLTRNQVPVWQNSETLFRHAVTVTTDNWFAWFNLGVVLDNQGRVDEALADYRKAVALQPNYVDALLNIGATLANRKQFADAIPFFERALRQNPDSVDSHDNLGHVLLEVGQPGAAIPHLRQVVQHRPQDLDALNILAEALARAGQFEQAVATAQKARDLALASGQKALAAKNQRLLESYQSRQAAHAPAESPPASPRDH
jgi:tetratricopeptide (TPR) repeat protein